MHTLPCIFRNRGIGLFTGSRSAGAAGRLPSLNVAAHTLEAWQPCALHNNDTFCCVDTFVDNLVTIAETPEKAIWIMADCEGALLRRWHLRIGADSKEFMTCKAYPRAVAVPGVWQRRTTLKCLGHFLMTTLALAVVSAQLPQQCADLFTQT